MYLPFSLLCMCITLYVHKYVYIHVHVCTCDVHTHTCIICTCTYLTTAGAVPGSLQEILPQQTQWPQTAVAALPRTVCAQGSISPRTHCLCTVRVSVIAAS